MAFSGKNIFTIVDFGTSKITVLHCRRDRAGNPEVAAFAQRSSDGAIVRGLIRDRAKAENILSATLADADAAMGGGCVRGNVYYVVTGPGISSRSGIGTTAIYGDDHLVTSEHVQEAVEKAENITLSPDQIILDHFQTAFILDSGTRVFDPVDYHASRMDAIVHIIIADRNRLTTFGSLLFNLGFEGQIFPLFSGVCSAYATLTRDERDQGVLLADVGAGTIDYFAVVKEGVVSSGVIPVGMDNLANDLAVGLEISMEQSRRILNENIFDAMRERGETVYELKSPGDKVRYIPFASMEKIISARLSETMTLLKKQLEKDGAFEQIRSGAVLTGGGALMPAVGEAAASVMELHVRLGRETDVSGAVTGLDSPRNSAAVGALKLILAQFSEEGIGGAIDKVTEALDSLTGGLFNSVRKFKRIIR